MRYPVARVEVVLHLFAAQVEVAVFEAGILVDLIGVVYLERQTPGRREQQEVVDQQFYLPRLDLRIFGALGTLAQFALDRQDVFAAQRTGAFVGLGVELRIENDLGRAGLVPELDEDDAAQVPAGAEPAVEDDLAAGVLKPWRAAVHGPFPRRVVIAFHH